MSKTAGHGRQCSIQYHVCAVTAMRRNGLALNAISSFITAAEFSCGVQQRSIFVTDYWGTL
jgi:hypothetical protein